MYTIETQQELPVNLQDAWDFFSNPNNLKVLTPSEVKMAFKGSPVDKIYEGQVIRYKISPLFGINVNWATQIDVVKEGLYFVDTQISGPFKVWHHQHHFESTGKGTIIKDLVHYQMPLGILGKVAHPILVKPKLKEIFDFRKRKIEEFFLQK